MAIENACRPPLFHTSFSWKHRSIQPSDINLKLIMLKTDIIKPKISVIVPVWNDPVRLKLCLEALTNQTLSHDFFEIIVVDNGSTDETPEIARGFEDVRLLTETRRGSYAARNTGLAEANGEYIAFTDADCIPDATWLENGLREFEADPELSLLSGRINLFPSGEHVGTTCLMYDQVFAFDQKHHLERAGCVATANWMSSRRVFDEVGTFRTDALSGCDFDLSRRIKNAGKKQKYCEAFVVKHPSRGNLAEQVLRRRRLTGGVWKRSKRSFKFISEPAMATLSILGEFKRLLSLKDVRYDDKARLTLFLGLMWFVALGECARLALGRDAERA